MHASGKLIMLSYCDNLLSTDVCSVQSCCQVYFSLRIAKFALSPRTHVITMLEVNLTCYKLKRFKNFLQLYYDGHLIGCQLNS